MSVTLDEIDRRILTLLQADASLTVNALAEMLGMTPPPCWRRLKRLKDAGCLKRQVWLVDPASVGLNVSIYADVKLVAHDTEATTAFREKVRALPEVVECYILLGSTDVLLKIIVPDIKYYETFFYEQLSQLPGVREITSSVVMTEVKATTSLPL
ncbi:Lrp/AsnC family transcriptional regulator [Acetobacteraceae bacterium H6797]|nr:Lrp/AsnC family transcriptional regulator [Acetobacteraceae bacterium H6797]